MFESGVLVLNLNVGEMKFIWFVGIHFHYLMFVSCTRVKIYEKGLRD